MKPFILLYETAFPREERRPTDQWLTLLESNPLIHLLPIEPKAGFLTYWTLDGFLYIEHFAIKESARGNGLGSRALREFLEAQAVQLPVILEVEPPATAIACRRIAFYQRCGFHLLDQPYLQPSYRNDGTTLPLRLMLYRPQPNTPVPPIEAIVRTLYREVYQYTRKPTNIVSKNKPHDS